MRASLQMTLRLLLRAPGLWVVSLGTAGLMGWVTSGSLLLRALQMMDMLLIPFFFLGQLLLTIASSQQERSERSEELLAALPYPLWRFLVGRAAGTYLAWVTVSLLLWTEIGLVSVVIGHPVDWLFLASHWLMAAPVTLLFTTALGLLLGQVIRQPLLGYIAGALVWLGARIGTIALSRDGQGLPPLFEFAASGLYFPLTDHGLVLVEASLYLNRLYVLGFALLLGAALLLLRSRERHLPTRPAALGILLAAVLTLGSAVGIVRPWQASIQAAKANVQAMPVRTFEDLEAPIRQVLAADQYQLDVQLDPESHRLTARGSWVLTNVTDVRIDQPQLGLRQTFTLSRLTTASGEPVAFRHEGNLLQLEHPLGPGESLSLQGEWSGTVWESRIKDGPKLGAHISTKSIVLPANWGWYPVATPESLPYQLKICPVGQRDCDPSIFEGGPVPPASFALSVTGSDLNLLHNAGERANGLYLVGTPYGSRQVAGVALNLSPLTRPYADEMAAEYAENMRPYLTMLPGRDDPLRIIEVSYEIIWNSPWARTAPAFPNALLLDGTTMGYRDQEAEVTRIYSLVLQSPEQWWRMNESHQLHDLTQGFAHFMYRSSQGRWYGSSANDPVAALLWQVEAGKGKETAYQILRQMYGERFTGRLTLERLIQVVQAAAGDDPKVQAALAGLATEGPR
ncbi:MAG TPA: ABC transporter permease [Symbiobacteriaceae bacterium]|nr:ABC transporter permease [Symbiobacteriaceae bacterium]